jgi:hypothetical protein
MELLMNNFDLMPGVTLSPEVEWSLKNCIKEKIDVKPDLHYIEKKDDIWKATVQNLLEKQEKIKVLEEEAKALKDSLIGMAGGLNAIGAGIRLSKSIRKGAIDYSKVPQIQNVNLDQFRKESIIVWTINQE